MSVLSCINAAAESTASGQSFVSSLATNSRVISEGANNTHADDVQLNLVAEDLIFDFDSNHLSLDNIVTDYTTENNFISNQNSGRNKDTILLLHYNIRSLNKNFDQLHLFMEKQNPESAVIGISETWLKDAPLSLFTINGFSLVTNNRVARRGGGVGL